MVSVPGSGSAQLPDVSSVVDVPPVPGAEGFDVAPEKLTEVADVISGAADVLAEKIRGRLGALRIEGPSADIVSTHAVRGWNTLIVDGAGSYRDQVQSYVDQLNSLAERLRAAGAEYEASDDDKAAAVRAAAAPGG